MKTFTRMLMLFAVISAVTLTSCSKDEEEAPDMTTKVSGEYQGTYKEGEGGSFITFEEIDATITKVSSNEIKVKLDVFPGITSEFNATMDTETTFTVPEFKLGDETMEGSGSVQNENSLDITLDGVSTTGYQITYVAERK